MRCRWPDCCVAVAGTYCDSCSALLAATVAVLMPQGWCHVCGYSSGTSRPNSRLVPQH